MVFQGTPLPAAGEGLSAGEAAPRFRPGAQRAQQTTNPKALPIRPVCVDGCGRVWVRVGATSQFGQTDG